MSNPLAEIRALGLPVTWATVRAGWDGIGAFSRLLKADDVRDFAQEQIDKAPDDSLADIVELSTVDDEGAVTPVLSRLASTVTDRDIRIWRSYLLTKLLANLPTSPISGLSELTSFWNTLGFPRDMPHVVQGLGNDISPDQYYTQDNYQKLVARHREWLRSEIAAIAGSSQL
jgi:hypothetical protein